MFKRLMQSAALRAPADEGAGGNPPAKDGGQPILGAEEFKQFTEGLASLRTDLGAFGGDLRELVKLARERNQAPVQQAEPDDGQTEEVELDATTLETLPRAQFMDHLLRKFRSNIEEAIKPLSDRINNVGVSAQTVALQAEGEKVKNANADFAEWKDEMIELSKQHPEMSIRRLYLLAKAESPEKAAEMAKKYPKKDEKDESTTSGDGKPVKSKAGNGKTRPFSLSPGGGGTSDTKNQRMTPKDAAEDAWEQTVAKFGSPFGR